MGTHNNASSPLQEILPKLKKLKHIGSNRHMAECPAHDDREGSLSISQGDDGRVLLKCFAGCATEDVVKALGIEMKDLFKKNGEGGAKSSRKNVAHLHKGEKSVDFEERIDRVLKMASYVELSNHEDFTTEFAINMNFNRD